MGVLKEEGLTIFKDRTELTADVKDIVSSFEAKKYNAAGRDIGKIFNVLLSPSSSSSDFEVMTFVGAVDESASTHYEDPNATGSCKSDEVDVQIQGIKGK